MFFIERLLKFEVELCLLLTVLILFYDAVDHDIIPDGLSGILFVPMVDKTKILHLIPLLGFHLGCLLGLLLKPFLLGKIGNELALLVFE